MGLRFVILGLGFSVQGLGCIGFYPVSMGSSLKNRRKYNLGLYTKPLTRNL
jgi:hypothetical protein